TVDNCTLLNNRSVGTPGGGNGLGGGILNYFNSVLTVSNTSFTGNQAIGGPGGTPTAGTPLVSLGQGGGLLNGAAVAPVTNCWFVRTQALGAITTIGPGGEAFGAGSENIGVPFVGPARLTLSNSTLSGNQAIGGSGGTTPDNIPGAHIGLAAGGGLDDSF